MFFSYLNHRCLIYITCIDRSNLVDDFETVFVTNVIHRCLIYIVHLDMSNFVDNFEAVEVGCHFRQMIDD